MGLPNRAGEELATGSRVYLGAGGVCVSNRIDRLALRAIPQPPGLELGDEFNIAPFLQDNISNYYFDIKYFPWPDPNLQIFFLTRVNGRLDPLPS